MTEQVYVERIGQHLFAREILTPDLRCVVFNEEHISERYLGWLNDPEVNRYSRRRLVRTSEAEARQFLANLGPVNQVLALTLRASGRHIGNLQLGPIHHQDSYGEVRILIGEKSEWGRGYGSQAIHAACSFYFQALELHRVEAMSCNPGFIHAVERLGWFSEGSLRERFVLDGRRLDYRCFGLLRREFVPTATLRWQGLAC